MDVDVSIKYMDRILRLPALNKYQQVLVECKDLENLIAGYQRTLGFTKLFSMELFCTWAKLYTMDRSGDPISGSERCTYF